MLTLAGLADDLVFSIGDGEDRVVGAWGTATDAQTAITRIRLHGVSSPDAIRVTGGAQAGDSNACLSYGDQGDRIVFVGWDTRTRWEQTLVTSDDGQARSLLSLLESQPGTDGDDLIQGPTFGMSLSGGAGNDTFNAGSPDNVFDGGAGDDTLNGLATYRFSTGWGHDCVQRPAGWQGNGLVTLDFGADISRQDVAFGRYLRGYGQDSEWMLRVVSRVDGSSVDMPLGAGGAYTDYTYRFRFSDQSFDVVNGQGAEYDGNDDIRLPASLTRFEDFSERAADGSHRVLEGDGGDDVLTSRRWRRISYADFLNDDGYWSGEDAYWLKGGEGNDTLRGATGDTLEGGRGNDRFETNGRDDVGPKVLKLALGDGQDVWRSDGFDWSALDDLVIDFGPGVKPESVFAEWVRTSPTLAGENHLVLHYGDLGDSLTLESVAIVAGELKADAQLRFADGTDTRLPEKIRSAAVTPETDGDDLIVDTPLGSTIESGRGNDRIVIFSGTYVYHAGHGKDVVDTYYGTIELADVTRVSQLSIDWVAGQDSGWRIGFAGREDSLFLRYDGVGYFSPTLRLGNGETVRIPPPPRYGTEGNDDLSAIGTADWNIHALAGSDTVSSGSGNDLLSGDAGNDWIRAGDGNDVVFFDRGDGVDTLDLEDFASAVDTLRFGQGISERDVALQRYGDDLYVRLNGSADAVWVRKHFVKVPSDGSYERNYGLDRIEFSSGVQWDATTIQAMVDRAANNHAPTVKTYLLTLKATADKVFTYTMASDVIVDPDGWDVVTYRMTRPDGSDMPAWLRFDADTRTLTATPTAAQVGDQWFVLWGTDLQGMPVGQYLGLSVAATPAGPGQLSPQASARLTPARADYDTPQRYDPASGNADMLRFLEGVAADQAWFRLGANQREFSAIGTGDEASFANGHSGNQYPMEWLGAGGEGALLVSQVNNLVSAMAAFAPPPAGQTTLPPDRTQSPAMVLAANWH